MHCGEKVRLGTNEKIKSFQNLETRMVQQEKQWNKIKKGCRIKGKIKIEMIVCYLIINYI